MSGKALYLYAIGYMNAKSAKVPPGIVAVPYDGLAAFVAPVSTDEQVLDREAMMAHHAIVRALWSFTTIVPVSFGMALRDQTEVIRLLQANKDKLKACLERLTGRVEVGLKVFWKKDVFAAKFGEHDPAVAELAKKVREIGEERAYPFIVKIGELVEARVQEARAAFQREVHNVLAVLAEDAVTNDVLTIRMVCNAAYLLPKEHERAFDEKVNQLLEPRLEEFDVRYTGPWPPYNFTRLRLEMPSER